MHCSSAALSASGNRSGSGSNGVFSTGLERARPQGRGAMESGGLPSWGYWTSETGRRSEASVALISALMGREMKASAKPPSACLGLTCWRSLSSAPLCSVQEAVQFHLLTQNDGWPGG